MRDYTKAILDYSEAIRLNPSYAQAYWGRGSCYRKQGDKAKAEQDFAQAKKLGYKPKSS
jgi:Flp pilus assembly protein TadD